MKFAFVDASYEIINVIDLHILRQCDVLWNLSAEPQLLVQGKSSYCNQPAASKLVAAFLLRELLQSTSKFSKSPA